MNLTILAASGVETNPLMILPFVAMLLAIAVMPFIHGKWWEHHFPKVSAGLGCITVIYYVFVLGNGERMIHVGHEYFSFMALVGSLFVVSGGIHIKVSGEAKPWMNCLFLLAGAVLANLVGTTGASMLLIRPWLRMNKYRVTGFHVVFFIFIISNAGGALTPIGDPPLFLGFLKGVPFLWVIQNCWRPWMIVVGGLIAVFYFLDRSNFMRAPAVVREVETSEQSWKMTGGGNLAFLLVIVGAVFIRSPVGLSEGLMIAAGLGSWMTTSKRVHEANAFGFGPIREVGWLFLGIFATMTPALDYLQSHAEKLGLDSAMKYFWSTGFLSGALDNAPTYLTFLAAAMGRQHLSLDNATHVQQYVSGHTSELMAISMGAVFFGAMTYIGNGPNFMVKAVAEEMKIKTPGFFTYIFRYALPILLPIFLIITLVFFRH